MEKEELIHFINEHKESDNFTSGVDESQSEILLLLIQRDIEIQEWTIDPKITNE